jgi:hypothetical protein
LVALLLSSALTPHAHPKQARAAGRLPTRGIFVPGTSPAGLELGDTIRGAKTVLGANHTLCTTTDSPLRSEPVCLFEDTRGEPRGAAAKFHNGRVSADFTLGAIDGSRTAEGLRMRKTTNNVLPRADEPR